MAGVGGENAWWCSKPVAVVVITGDGVKTDGRDVKMGGVENGWRWWSLVNTDGLLGCC